MEKRMDQVNKSFTSRMQARLLLVFCVITLLMVALMGRLIYINQVDGERYAKKVLSRQSYVSAILPYKRGDIVDCNGTVLATSELLYRLIVDPKLLLENEEYIDPTMKALKDSFGVENETFQTILKDKPNSQYVIVTKNLKYDVVDSFKALMSAKESKIKGVWFEEEYVRTYPYNTLACDVLGFTSADNIGYWGIEEYYNDELNGTNGREYGYYDSNLNIERIEKKAVNGNSIITTIDANVQRIIQEKIAEFNEETGSKNIGVLVMNPNNGAIIAMASNQEYNLNDPRNLDAVYTKEEQSALTENQKTQALNELWKNYVISNGYEPGSTFKPFTIAAALEEGAVTAADSFYCDGFEDIAGTIIHCNKRVGHGDVTLAQALMVSCNDALMQIADKEGKGVFTAYQKSFGFGAKTGIDLPGEEKGIIVVKDSMGPVDLATNCFGQNFNATMIQMAAGFSSLVNGGYYYQPHVVKQIINDNGAVVKENNGVLVRQTVSEETSEFIQESLYQTVEAGTAQGAQVAGYSIGGKTATAQKQPRADKTYIVSFLGCAPAIDPEVVIYVTVDEPQNVEKQADSSIATKFASKIMNEILPALGIYPEGEIDYLIPTSVPGDNGTTGTEAAGTTGTESTKDNAGTTGAENTEGNAGATGEGDTAAGNSEDTSGTEDETQGTASDNQDTTNNENGTTREDTSGTTGDTAGNNSTQDTESGTEDEFNPDALD